MPQRSRICSGELLAGQQQVRQQQPGGAPPPTALMDQGWSISDHGWSTVGGGGAPPMAGANAEASPGARRKSCQIPGVKPVSPSTGTAMPRLLREPLREASAVVSAAGLVPGFERIRSLSNLRNEWHRFSSNSRGWWFRFPTGRHPKIAVSRPGSVFSGVVVSSGTGYCRNIASVEAEPGAHGRKSSMQTISHYPSSAS